MNCKRCGCYLVADWLEPHFNYCFICVRWWRSKAPGHSVSRVRPKLNDVPPPTPLRLLVERARQLDEEGEPLTFCREDPNDSGKMKLHRVTQARFQAGRLEVSTSEGWQIPYGDELRAWLMQVQQQPK